MNNSHFRRGRGVFHCGVCGRACRDAGQSISSECCVQCYELAGIDNMVNDSGLPIDAQALAFAERVLAKIIEKGGDGEKAKAEFGFIWKKEAIS